MKIREAIKELGKFAFAVLLLVILLRGSLSLVKFMGSAKEWIGYDEDGHASDYRRLVCGAAGIALWVWILIIWHRSGMSDADKEQAARIRHIDTDADL